MSHSCVSAVDGVWQIGNQSQDDFHLTAVRQTHLVDTDIESDPEEAPSEIEEFQPLFSRAPITDEEFEVSKPSDTRITLSHSPASLNSTAPLLPTHSGFTHPSFVPP
ncbi:hypothetical protein Tco_1169984 [Tanacetum coccineum]